MGVVAARYKGPFLAPGSIWRLAAITDGWIIAQERGRGKGSPSAARDGLQAGNPAVAGTTVPVLRPWGARSAGQSQPRRQGRGKDDQPDGAGDRIYISAPAAPPLLLMGALAAHKKAGQVDDRF